MNAHPEDLGSHLPPLAGSDMNADSETHHLPPLAGSARAAGSRPGSASRGGDRYLGEAGPTPFNDDREVTGMADAPIPSEDGDWRAMIGVGSAPANRMDVPPRDGASEVVKAVGVIVLGLVVLLAILFVVAIASINPA